MKKFLLLAFALCTTGAFAQSEIYPQHFNLEEVTLLNSPFKTAMDKNIQHLLEYDVDRLLTPYVRQAGLNTGDYAGWTSKHPNHENWGSGTFRLDGHVGGHYMTALALAYAATTDAILKAEISSRVSHILHVLKDCQNAYDSSTDGMYGFIGGQPCNDAWKQTYKGTVGNFGYSAVPLYCQHKILAGLRDMFLYMDGDNAEQSKAIYKKLCDWHVNLISKMTDTNLQNWLNTEHGGVNETLVDAYRIFGEDKYLAAAKRYSHNYEINGMQTVNKTFLDNQHANTQVPKFIGFARIAQEDATATKFKTAALNFWTDVAQNRTVCIGGNSVNEHFLSAAASNRYIDETNGPESCNTNNMMKLSEDLFDDTHDGKYADFYEAAMYNHILSTQDPVTGGYVYFTPLRPQSYRIYSKPNQDMWCCVGTGMENHSKYGHFIYTHKDNTLYLNLFIASKLQNDEFALTQETTFPYEQATHLTVDKSGDYAIAIRKPSWVTEGYGVKVNGADVNASAQKGYVTISRNWQKGDVIQVELPMILRYETCPNYGDYIAFKYGPILLGAKTSADGEELEHEYALGERMGHAPDSYAPKKALSTMPMLLGSRANVMDRIKVLDKDALTFTLDCSRDDELAGSYLWDKLTLEPYYALQHCRWSCYFYQATLNDYLSSSWAKEEAKEVELDARSLSKIDVGQQQAEAGAVTYDETSERGIYKDESYRDAKAGGWIEIVLDNDQPLARNLSLMLRYTTADQGRKCDILVNSKLLQTYTIPSNVRGANSNGFYNLEIPLGEMAYDEQGNALNKFIIRLEANKGTMMPGLYYIRLMKDYAPEDFSYKFNASEWAFTGDAGRVAQGNISIDNINNSISVKSSGTNNMCLKFSSNEEYDVALSKKYLVVCATNLTTTKTNNYLWWLNCANNGSQYQPEVAKQLSDGRYVIAWNISSCSFNSNCKTDPWVLTSKKNANSTLFGLTQKTASEPCIVSYIGFIDKDELDNFDDFITLVPELSTTDNNTTSAVYTLDGSRHSSLERGINIVNGKKVLK